ncbi:hypothetical protein LIH_02480 [Leptospira interrogans serovar Hardjo-prajitno]|nr:hypothetical protein LIH_02480 [Leptospira interrogans serovar Hardjo-prajitno]
MILIGEYDLKQSKPFPSMPEFLKFVWGRPSCFEFPEKDDYFENARKHFTPRDKDERLLSLWELDTNSFCIAAFIVRRPESPSRPLSWVKLTDVLLNRISLQPEHNPDGSTFSCVSSFHYLLNLVDITRIDSLVTELQSELNTQGPSIFETIEKSRIKPFLQQKDSECSNYETEKLASWVESYLK